MRRFLSHLVVAGAVAAAVVLGAPSLASAGHHGAHVVVPPGQAGPRVGPSSLYPDPTLTPGATNPNITQANIADTICNPNWSTKTIRPPASYTNNLKKQQLGAARYVDKTPSHYEEDHLISLELGGNPRDPKNLWPEMWGTLAQPLTSRGPFPPELVGAKAKDAVENALHHEVCAGALTLKAAQSIIATDWFKYYKDKILK
jgi:hypothetical protein